MRHPAPDQTLTAFDLPKMYVESYGVHNIEYQHTTIVQSEKDPDFIKELKARLDESSVKMTQINLEFGTVQSISHKDPEGRRQAVEHVKQWIDIAAQYGCPRVMINQQQVQLTNETRAGAVEAMKAMADYGRPKNVKVSAETRGAGTPEYVQQIGGVKPWEFMIGVIKDAGAASNVDIGNVGAMNQQELHDCIKGWFPYSSGNMHIKSSPFWDVGQAVKFTESLGYRGCTRSRSRDTRPCGSSTTRSWRTCRRRELCARVRQSSRSRRTDTRWPRSDVRRIAAMTSSADAAGTSTIEKRSAICTMPRSREDNPASFAIAPMRSAGLMPA